MPKLIPLTQGKYAIVDDEDFERVSQLEWRCIRAGRSEYAVVKGRIRVFMHRFILDAPSGMEVDHKDGDGLNNIRTNIRLATHAQNMFNRRPHQRIEQASRYKGVVWHSERGKWRARITVARKRISLGLFVSELDAARAYNEAAIEHFGEFARLNILPG